MISKLVKSVLVTAVVFAASWASANSVLGEIENSRNQIRIIGSDNSAVLLEIADQGKNNEYRLDPTTLSLLHICIQEVAAREEQESYKTGLRQYRVGDKTAQLTFTVDSHEQTQTLLKGIKAALEWKS